MFQQEPIKNIAHTSYKSQAFNFRKFDFEIWVEGEGQDMSRNFKGSFGSMRTIFPMWERILDKGLGISVDNISQYIKYGASSVLPGVKFQPGRGANFRRGRGYWFWPVPGIFGQDLEASPTCWSYEIICKIKINLKFCCWWNLFKLVFIMRPDTIL